MRVHILKVYRNITLTEDDMKITEKLIAWHVLTNTVSDRLLNAKATWREEA